MLERQQSGAQIEKHALTKWYGKSDTLFVAADNAIPNKLTIHILASFDTVAEMYGGGALQNEPARAHRHSTTFGNGTCSFDASAEKLIDAAQSRTNPFPPITIYLAAKG